MPLTVKQLLDEKKRLEQVVAEADQARRDIRALDTFLGHFGVDVPKTKPRQPPKEATLPCGVEGCDKKYTSKQMVDRHRIVHHGYPEPEVTVPCLVCGRKFATEMGVKTHHTRTHGGVPS